MDGIGMVYNIRPLFYKEKFNHIVQAKGRLQTWYKMCIQLASLGPETCFKISPHFSNSLKTKLVSYGENLHRNSIFKSMYTGIYL